MRFPDAANGVDMRQEGITASMKLGWTVDRGPYRRYIKQASKPAGQGIACCAVSCVSCACPLRLGASVGWGKGSRGGALDSNRAI
jgi:hypothetical protein